MSKNTYLSEVPKNIDFKLYFPKLMDTLNNFEQITNIPNFGTSKINGREWLFS